jgi:hypothetical protein
MMTCEAVAMLPGWDDSRGANIEFNLARSLGMPVMALEYYLSKDYPGLSAMLADMQREASQIAGQIIDLGNPLEFCDIDIDAIHQRHNTIIKADSIADVNLDAIDLSRDPRWAAQEKAQAQNKIPAFPANPFQQKQNA